MIESIADRILGLHGWAAAAVVFALPALESSAFVEFVLPGEIACCSAACSPTSTS